MACLLALILAATVLTVPSGNNKLLANAARTSPAEAFWRTALPGAPMPEAIHELLHPHAGGKATVLNKDDDGDDPPPMNFNYDDYRSVPRRDESTAPPSAEVPKHAATSAQNAANDVRPTVFILEDATPADGPDPLRLYTVCAVRAASEGRNDADVMTYVCRAKTTSGTARASESPGFSP